jgi:hypothetical protein
MLLVKSPLKFNRNNFIITYIFHRFLSFLYHFGIATGCELDDRVAGVRVPVGSIWSRSALGATKANIQWAPGFFPQGINQQEHEAKHSPPTSVEGKKTWIYTSTPP